jgi:methionyl-tRNA synthetase
MADRYYITTAIAYVNGRPHIGHALEFVQADCFARYHRLRGEETFFLTGTDENALKNVQAAENEGIPVQELVERNALHFQDLDERLDVRYNKFIRTAADPLHTPGAQKLWVDSDKAGDIYKKHYVGLYCVRCEKFLDPQDPADMFGGVCAIHGIPPEEVEEENYFFRLSKYSDQLEELIATDQYQIIPETRKNEVLSFIRRGLQDFSVSRSQERARGWGVPVPNDPSQVIYVWFDALANYITALDYAGDGDLYETFWAQNPNRIHCVGKDIIRFHAIYWPAMLLSAGVPLPQKLFVHGFINLKGEKLSKSSGVVIDPALLAHEYGSEALRYYLLRGVNPTSDSDYSTESFEARYNADLANDLGNLLNRTVSMIARYRDGIVPEAGVPGDLESSVAEVAARAEERTLAGLDRYDPQSALESTWELVTRTNRYVEESAPWSLSKAAKNGDAEAERKLDSALATLAKSLKTISALLEPFLPNTASRIRDQLGIGEGAASWADRLAWSPIAPGTQVGKPEPIFPRLEAPVTAG